jgi:hypothetical protein
LSSRLSAAYFTGAGLIEQVTGQLSIEPSWEPPFGLAVEALKNPRLNAR